MIKKQVAASFAAVLLVLTAVNCEAQTNGSKPITPKEIKAEGLTGSLFRFESFPTELVIPRNVDVWLPPDYSPAKRFAVLYMHDGQNLFIPELSYTKTDWGVDETAARMMKEGKLKDFIVVGIWNSPNRVGDYMPAKALKYATQKQFDEAPEQIRNSLKSNEYLKFIVDELKPFIDRTYPTKPDRESTFIMGSSMGGLISCYAIAEYPEVFGGAGCVSTHWPAGEGIVIDYLRDNLPDPKDHTIYFDYGTEALDAQYEPYQKKMDEVMKARGYTAGKNWITMKFEGANHSEKAWRARLDIPLRFLLGQ